MQQRPMIWLGLAAAAIAGGAWWMGRGSPATNTISEAVPHRDAVRRERREVARPVEKTPAPEVAVDDGRGSPADQVPPTVKEVAPVDRRTAAPAAPAVVRAALPPAIPVLPPAVPKALAREALGYVGEDRVAEAVWYSAINDERLDAETRKDLIEDLNEDGFPDPKHVTADDLPLIESRIALIEDIAGDAMDDVNEGAFAEAYKDLVNMRENLIGPG